MLVRELQAKAERQLYSRKVPEAEVNVELILAHVLGCRRPEVRLNGARSLSAKQEHQAWHLVLERSKRIPMAYVLGTQEFMGLELRVTPSVLIPRPETEELVQTVVDLARMTKAAHLLDIGTGSGCVSVALAHLLPEAQIVATEISPAALELAEKNARAHDLGRRIRFLKADLFQPGRRAAKGWADIAVSNPPYIPTAELPKLEPEVLREPRLALDGGQDGLDAIKAIINEAPIDLKPGGWLVLEIGHDQDAAVRRLLAEAGYVEVQVRPDAQGVPRIALGRLPA